MLYQQRHKPQPSIALIQQQIPLADKNWFRTGGPARYFAEPTTAAEFQEALAFAREQQLPVFILGHGANILISDVGFDGLVIRPALTDTHYQEIDANYTEVTAGAGLSFADLINHCLDKSLLGLEEFSGIPGTVGGSVYINIHYYEFLLSQFMVRARVIERATGTIHTVEPSWFNFGYDYSTLHSDTHYLLDATFKLKKADALQISYARGRQVEIIRHRVRRYPNAGTCGSFFRNFHDDEVHLTDNGKKMVFVAYYLDKIGVKGALSIGGAGVSYQHANMLINHGTATSSDIIEVARLMQEKVRAEFGIIPQPECVFVGFPEYPLIK